MATERTVVLGTTTPLIVVIDDSAEIRSLMSLVLRNDGYKVLEARDGVVGLALVKLHKPDLVVSDVQMPGMNGIELVLALRQDPDLAATPVILLTALQERADMRQGMSAGADDYITKPFTRQELSQAVATQLAKREIHDGRHKRVVTELLLDQKKRLTGLYERRLSRELQQRWPTHGDGSEEDERFDHAIALFADIVGYPGLAEKLSADELSEVVKRFYGSAGDTMYLFGARHMHFVGEGVLALFAQDNDTDSVNHTRRALRAAVGLQDTARAVGRFLGQRYADRELPEFRVTAGLHCGAVTLAKLQDPITGSAAQTLLVGETVGLAIRLQQHAGPLHWCVMASREMVDSLPDGVNTRGDASIDVPGRSKGIEVCEVLGLKTP
ncbi:MAG: response regulator receiver protein [Ramlibacter sp.]|jgi:CheY-like chemotaxis protein|nr:response regulator receiver protein [Ramlibacter sp.]